MVVDCISDSVTLGSSAIRKESVLVIAVVLDMVCTLIMLRFLWKLEKFFNNFLKVHADHHLAMKDFAISCDNCMIDKTTQDTRLVKMKIWLHFTKILSRFDQYTHEQGLKHQVIDVTLSISTQPKLKAIYKMQEFKSKIEQAKVEQKKFDESDKKFQELENQIREAKH
jgi:hypothetical protein